MSSRETVLWFYVTELWLKADSVEFVINFHTRYITLVCALSGYEDIWLCKITLHSGFQACYQKLYQWRRSGKSSVSKIYLLS
jgi:hypothetical protein